MRSWAEESYVGRASVPQFQHTLAGEMVAVLLVGTVVIPLCAGRRGTRACDGAVVMFGLVVSQILLARVMEDCQNLLRFLTQQPKKYLIFIAHDHCILMLLWTIPTAVVLSQWMGVSGWG